LIIHLRLKQVDKAGPCFHNVQPGSGGKNYNATLDCSSIDSSFLNGPLSHLDQPHLTAGWGCVPTRRGLPQPGANQRVVLTAGVWVNPEPLGRIS